MNTSFDNKWNLLKSRKFLAQHHVIGTNPSKLQIIAWMATHESRVHFHAGQWASINENFKRRDP
jgi:hypothetical protein